MAPPARRSEVSLWSSSLTHVQPNLPARSMITGDAVFTSQVQPAAQVNDGVRSCLASVAPLEPLAQPGNLQKDVCHMERNATINYGTASHSGCIQGLV